MFPGIAAATPVLAILGIAVGLQTVKMGLKIFGKGEWTYYADTLGLILVTLLVLNSSLDFLKKVAEVFK